MYRMTRRERERRADNRNAILYGLLGLSIIAAIGGAGFWIKNRHVVIDEISLCPKSGPTGIHLFIFDRTDPISPQQAAVIRPLLEKRAMQAKAGERFDLYTIEGDLINVLPPVLQVCSPGRAEDANRLYQNPEFIRRRFEEKFLLPMNRVIDGLLQASTRPNSPILETLKAAAISSFGRVDRGELPLEIILISDMIQHSPVNSHYKSEPNFGELKRSVLWPAARPNLKGAEIEILYVLRPRDLRNGKPIQNRGHQQFWEQLISDSGGHIISIEPL